MVTDTVQVIHHPSYLCPLFIRLGPPWTPIHCIISFTACCLMSTSGNVRHRKQERQRFHHQAWSQVSFSQLFSGRLVTTTSLVLNRTLPRKQCQEPKWVQMIERYKCKSQASIALHLKYTSFGCKSLKVTHAHRTNQWSFCCRMSRFFLLIKP